MARIFIQKMHFLCLHGKGTNSKIFETQLSKSDEHAVSVYITDPSDFVGAIVYQLGDGHTYEFVEGTVPEVAAPGTYLTPAIFHLTPPRLTENFLEIRALFSSTENFFAFFEEQYAGSCLAALKCLEYYIEVQGPFDGIIAFSQGSALAATLLVQQARQESAMNALKLAIFFSGGIAADPDLLETGLIAPMNRASEEGTIQIPTVHIWGRIEKGESDWPPQLLKLCKAQLREEFQHEAGHEIPGSKDRAAVTSIVQIIRRAIWKAENNGDL